MFLLILIVCLAVGAVLLAFGSRRLGAQTPQIRLPGKKMIVTVLVLILAAAAVLSSVYQLQEDEYAVITTFGKPSVVNTSGLKFKIPLIQKKRIVSKATQGFAIGYNMANNASIEDESLMISVEPSPARMLPKAEKAMRTPVKLPRTV